MEDLEQLSEKLQFILRDSFTPFLENVQLKMEEQNVKAIAPLPNTIKVIRKNQAFVIYIFYGDNLEDNEITLSCYDIVSK